MTPTTKKFLLRIAQFAVFLMIMVWIGPKLLEYRSLSFLAPYAYSLWLSISLLFITAILLLDHILGWFGKGRLRIDIGYLLITAALLLMNVSALLPLRMPLMVINGIAGFYQISILAFWYCLLKTFYKET